MEMDIRLATPADVPEMMALEARNYVGNLDASERADRFISILHPQPTSPYDQSRKTTHTVVASKSANSRAPQGRLVTLDRFG